LAKVKMLQAPFKMKFYPLIYFKTKQFYFYMYELMPGKICHIRTNVILCNWSNSWDCIGGLMVSMLALSALDCDSSPDLRARTGWIEIRIMCLSGSICLYMDCCLSELAIQKSNYVCWPGTKHTLSST
jgi:hypothetical protein